MTELIDEDVITKFTNCEHCNDDKKTTVNDSLVLKCLRKKYKCIMLWLLSIITVTQFLILIFKQLDETIVNDLTTLITNAIKSVPKK
jgi:hypothetical protein